MRRAVVAALLMALSPGLRAQVQRSIINPSFEEPILVTPGCRVHIDQALVPGWSTSHPAYPQNNAGCTGVSNATTSASIIELWRTPRSNSSGGTVNAPGGVQIAELNAEVPSRLYQNVCLISGEVFRWRFSHRGRTSATLFDPANFVVGTALIAQVGTTNTGTFRTPVAGSGAVVNTPTAVPGNATWINYSGTFTYSGATGFTALGFEAANALNSAYAAPTGSTTDATLGNLLDDIQIEMAPFVDFLQPTSSAVESAGNNLPQLRVNGTVYSPMTVVVNITGGTATLGSDYTTPGNSTSLSITIPKGTYDGQSSGSLFTLPVTIINDTIVEGNETILFQIQQSTTTPQAYYRRSNTNCGQAGVIDSTYTIIGDDVQLAVTKNAAAPVPVAGQANLFDIVYTIVVSNTSTASSADYALSDQMGWDPNASVVSASYTVNAGTANTLSGSGPWTLQGQWKTLAPGGSDTYRLTVRGSIVRNGSVANDACTAPSTSGRGLHNVATGTLRAVPTNQTYASSACQPTPTPFWLQLDKQFTQRAQSSDQAQVRIYGGGLQVASATTASSGLTASIAAVPYKAGTLIDLRETLLLNGTTPSAPSSKYVTSIVCSNATVGSGTPLPGGAGLSISNEQAWSSFGPIGGDDITCTIINRPKADLFITKSNNVTQVSPGSTTTYSLVVANNGPADVSGALLKDTPGAGMSGCSAVTCSAGAATGGASCPTPLTISALLAGTQTVSLPAGSSVTLQVTCQASP